MKKKYLSLFMIIAITVFAFVPFINVDAGSIGFIGSGKIVNFNQTGTNSESVASSTNMETYINAKKDEFESALNEKNVTVDLSKSNIDPNDLFSTTKPYKYAVVDNISSGYQMVQGTLTQTYTVDYVNVNVKQYGHNNIWATSGGKVAVLYKNRDSNEQPDLDGNTWVQNGLVVDYEVGDEITVKSKPDSGYSFIGWYVSNVQQGAEYYDNTKLVSQNLSYTYTPGVTTVTGINEPINYLTAVYKEDQEIIRVTSTVYHTKVIGTLNLTGTDTYSKNYSSGDNYIDGNTTDSNIASIISGYRDDMNTIANSYHAYPWSVSEGITDYYYETHDEITQNMNNGQVTINTVLNKYQTYKIIGKGTTKNIKTINITLEGPFVGDDVTLTPMQGLCLNAGGCYTPSVKPDVSTTDAHVEVDALWVTSVNQLIGDVGVNYFSGNIERGERYKAIIFVKAIDGYKLADNVVIKVNGSDPDSVMNIMNDNEEVPVVTEIESQVRKVEYKLDDERGNQIIFTDDDGIVYVFNSTDILNITDEEIEAIASEMGKTIEEVTEMANKAIESAKKAAEGKGTLIGLYDFSVFDGHNFKEQAEGGFKIRIKMTDEMKKYDTFSIGFMKDDGTLDQLITLKRNGDYLEGILPHLSTYAIIGSKVEVTEASNPKTGDNIYLYVTLLGLSLVGLYIKKKRFN